ncbi:MAG: metallophosphoesterase family protein [Desulfuromonadales bacterium]
MSTHGNPIRIGVLSDTHLPNNGDSQAFLLDLVASTLAPLDMLLHAGDLVDPDLLTVFTCYPVHVVRGNMDPVTPGVPLKKIVTIGGFTIGIIHGWGPPRGLEERVLAEFSSEALDCLVFGHSHRPVCHRRDGILLFNPGSATDRRGMPAHTVGLLEISDSIHGTIIALD